LNTKGDMFHDFTSLHYVPTNIRKVRVTLKGRVILQYQVAKLALKRYSLVRTLIGMMKTAYSPGV
ncbi:hypothetical protein SERLA73DRAFT_145590, partial [Serpula lacrymans var. lacrymans S7.3]